MERKIDLLVYNFLTVGAAFDWDDFLKATEIAEVSETEFMDKLNTYAEPIQKFFDERNDEIEGYIFHYEVTQGIGAFVTDYVINYEKFPEEAEVVEEIRKIHIENLASNQAS